MNKHKKTTVMHSILNSTCDRRKGDISNEMKLSRPFHGFSSISVIFAHVLPKMQHKAARILLANHNACKQAYQLVIVSLAEEGLTNCVIDWK